MLHQLGDIWHGGVDHRSTVDTYVPNFHSNGIDA